MRPLSLHLLRRVRTSLDRNLAPIQREAVFDIRTRNIQKVESTNREENRGLLKHTSYANSHSPNVSNSSHVSGLFIRGDLMKLTYNHQR